MSWLGISLFAGVVTLANLIDAWQGWRWLRTNGARAIQARANLRSETLRLGVCAALAVPVLPSLGRPGDIPLSPELAILMCVPLLVAIDSYLDRRTRRTLARMRQVAV